MSARYVQAALDLLGITATVEDGELVLRGAEVVNLTDDDRAEIQAVKPDLVALLGRGTSTEARSPDGSRPSSCDEAGQVINAAGGV